MREVTPITLNLQAPNVNVIVHAKEGDRAGRFINAKLVDGAREFIPPENAHFVVRYMKADGNGGLYDTMEDNETPAVTLSGNIATIGIAEQALTTQGLTQMELNIYDGNATRISAFKFNMIVEETVLPDGEVESTEYFNILTHEIALALQASGVVQAVVNMTVEAEELPAGSTPTVEKDYDPDAGTLKLTFGLVKGQDGKTAYQSAVDGGYTGTEAEFNVELSGLNEAATAAAASAAAAAQSKADVQALAETIAGNVGIDDDYTGEDTTWSSSKIQEELDEQSSRIAELDKHIIVRKRRNLLDESTVENDTVVNMNTGSTYTAAGYKTTDFIKVNQGDHVYSLSFSNQAFRDCIYRYAFYDEDKTYVSGGQNSRYGDPGAHSIEVPQNGYIRISHAVTTYNRWYVTTTELSQKGFGQYAFEPYRDYDIQITDLDWYDTSLLTYGDSITAINNGDSNCIGWAKTVCDYFGISTHHGRGVGGQTFVWNASTFQVDENGNYVDRGTTSDNCKGTFCSWERINKMIPEAIKDTIDMIIIMGGTNDFGSNTSPGVDIETEPLFSSDNIIDEDWIGCDEYNGGDFDITKFKGAVASTVMKMQARCPQATIILATPLSGRGTNKNHMVNTSGQTLRDYAEAIIDVANYMSVPCIDVNGTCKINQFNYDGKITDGTHPYSIIGCELLGVSIIERIKTISRILK